MNLVPVSERFMDNLDLVKLAFPFQFGEHKFLQGNVYIREAAIANRLDRVDPAWEFHIVTTTLTNHTFYCTATLRVMGAVRTNVGAGSFLVTKKGGEIMEPIVVDQNTENAAKAAATDAFKRAARLFGIGRYLLSAPKELDFKPWLNTQLNEANAKYKEMQAQVGSVVVTVEDDE